VVAAGYEAAELKSRAAEDEKVAAEAAYYRSLRSKTLVAGIVAAPLFVGRCSWLLPALTLPVAGCTADRGARHTVCARLLGGHFFRGAWKSLP